MDAFGAQPSCVDASDARVQELVAEAVGSVIGDDVIAAADLDLVKSCKDVVDKGFCGITAETDECCECAIPQRSQRVVGWQSLCPPGMMATETGRAHCEALCA